MVHQPTFEINDIIKINKIFINTLPNSKSNQILTQSLGYLSNRNLKTLQLGAIDTKFFLRVLPLDANNDPDSSHGEFNNGKGVVLYFETADQRKNSFVAGIKKDIKTEDLALHIAHSAKEDAILAYRTGIRARQVSIPLPAIVAGGSVDVGLWVAHRMLQVTALRIAYLTAPSSTLGTVVADVNKISGGVTTLMQATANFDLEGLTNGLATTIPLATTAQKLLKNDYLYATLTSNNGDAVAGTGGVLTIDYTILNINR